MSQTIEQRRADSAWKRVSRAHVEANEKAKTARKNASDAVAKEIDKALQDLNAGGEKFRKSYGGLARSLPALVQTDGLGQAMAFLRAKGKDKQYDPHNCIYSDISEWVVKQLGERKIDLQGRNDLLQVICTLDSHIYRMAVVESLAYLRWLKRFAEAELPEPEGGSES